MESSVTHMECSVYCLEPLKHNRLLVLLIIVVVGMKDIQPSVNYKIFCGYCSFFFVLSNMVKQKLQGFNFSKTNSFL